MIGVLATRAYKGEELQMRTPNEFAAIPQRRNAEIRSACIYIPRNDLGIRSGYYRDAAIASLLRGHPGKARAILRIARNVG